MVRGPREPGPGAAALAEETLRRSVPDAAIAAVALGWNAIARQIRSDRRWAEFETQLDTACVFRDIIRSCASPLQRVQAFDRYLLGAVRERGEKDASGVAWLLASGCVDDAHLGPADQTFHLFAYIANKLAKWKTAPGARQYDGARLAVS